MKYNQRIAEKAVKRFLKAFPVVGITGPRQSGKSTLLRQLLKDYDYVTFDDIRNIEMFEDDPIGFMERYPNQVIFDEVQLAPKIFNMIKIAVDQDRDKYGRFVLTGSSQFSFLKSASESLAGRIGLLSLLPFQFQEMPKALADEAIYQGSYPELVMRNYEEAELWYSSYIETYLNKDLRTIANIGDMRDFTRFIRLLASCIGQVLDMTYFSKSLGVSSPTIKRWISVLEASYIVFLLPPLTNNIGKRLIKSPKIYFYDTGLVSFLTGIQSFKQYDQGPLGGHLFENYIVSEIYKRELHTGSQSDLYFLRTYDKVEVDLIIDRKQYREWIEIKKSSTFKTNMIRSLLHYHKDNDQLFLVYQGKNDHFKGVEIQHYHQYLSCIS